MSRTYSQTVNAARMFNIVPGVDLLTGMMTLTTNYQVGFLADDGRFNPINAALASPAVVSVVVPLTTTLADANMQLQVALATQEGLDITQSVQEVTITAGGSGYVAPTVVFSAPQILGTVATGTVSLTDDAVTGVVVTDEGSGYLAPPTVTISDSTGTGAVATAIMLVGDRVLAPAG